MVRHWICELFVIATDNSQIACWDYTLSESKLEFSTKDLAIEFAKKNKIDFFLIEPKKRKIVKKSYADNFT